MPPPSTSTVPNSPLICPPKKLPGPAPKPIARSGYEAPKRIRRIKRTYTQRRKREVLMFLENHRIPLRQDLSDLRGVVVVGDTPVEEGFRRPFLREAASYFGIPNWTTVQTWWSKRNHIWKGPRRRDIRYRPKWPQLEVRLFEEFCTARKNRRLVQRTWFRRRAIAIFTDLYPECPDLFVFSNGWFSGFLRRHDITHRRVTHASTRVPEEIVKYTNEFLQFIRRNSKVEAWKHVTLMSDPVDGLSMQRFPPHLIVNLDETPMPFEFIQGFTFDHKGTKSVQGRSERSGWSKRQATLILTIVGDGSYVEELKPVIIFQGKGNVLPKEGSLYNSGVDVKFNDTAYNNEDLFEDWIRTRLAPFAAGRECLLVIDVARFHKTEKVQAALKDNNITTALIPPGLTGYLQPLDVGFNGPFKKWLRDETDLYLDRLDDAGKTPDRWSVRDRRIMTTHVVANAWQRAFSDDNKVMISNLFKKTGISIHPDGREDHLISIKGIEPSKLQLGDWYLAPDLRKNYDISEALTSLDGDDEFVTTAEALDLPPNTYRSQTNKVLMGMCRERGLPVSGRKSLLIRRLEDDDIAKERQRRRERGPSPRESDEESTQEGGGDRTLVVQEPAEDPVYPPLDTRTRAASSGFGLDTDMTTPGIPHDEERAAGEQLQDETSY